jgi:hypothetical protein
MNSSIVCDTDPWLSLHLAEGLSLQMGALELVFQDHNSQGSCAQVQEPDLPAKTLDGKFRHENRQAATSQISLRRKLRLNKSPPPPNKTTINHS